MARSEPHEDSYPSRRPVWPQGPYWRRRVREIERSGSQSEKKTSGRSSSSDDLFSRCKLVFRGLFGFRNKPIPVPLIASTQVTLATLERPGRGGSCRRGDLASCPWSIPST